MNELTRELLQVAIYCGLLPWRFNLFLGRWRMPLLHGPEYFLGKRVPEGFYQGPGAAILREHRAWLLLPWLLEAIALTVLVATHRFVDYLTWLLLASTLVGVLIHAWAYRRALKAVKPYTLPGEAPRRFALALEPREFKRYNHPAFEIALAALSLIAMVTIIRREGWSGPTMAGLVACYLQAGLLLVKRALLDWRSPVPVKDAELYHRLREEQRRFFMRFADWLRAFAVFFVVQLAIASWWGADPVRWLSATVGIAFLIAFGTTVMRDTRRLTNLTAQVRPVKLPKPPPDSTATHVFVYRPDYPRLLVRRTRGWSLNLGNPRTLLYCGYILAGLVLGAAGLRAV